MRKCKASLCLLLCQLLGMCVCENVIPIHFHMTCFYLWFPRTTTTSKQARLPREQQQYGMHCCLDDGVCLEFWKMVDPSVVVRCSIMYLPSRHSHSIFGSKWIVHTEYCYNLYDSFAAEVAVSSPAAA